VVALSRQEAIPTRAEWGDRAVPRISVEALTKSFGHKVAVDAVDLVVEPGTFLVLLGPSGSGKSTLLRCLAGIERATSGSIRFGALEVDGPGGHLPPERRDLAMVFQDYALWPHLSAENNVGFALKRHHLPAAERRRQAQAMLDQVGLSGLSDRYPGQLSGGEQQRVALARALVGRPGLLLFDEPLSNLDADRRERLRIDIGAMARAQGATAIYITHDQSEAFALADVIGVLRGGRLVQIGPPEEIYLNPADEFVARFTGLAGELPGRVREPAGDTCDWLSVDVGGAVVHGRSVGPRLQPGQPVQVLVRPSALRFTGPSADGHSSLLAHAGAVPSPCATVPVAVCDAAFRGWGYEHVVEVPGGHRLTGVGAGTRLAYGASAHVELAAQGCLVVPRAARPDSSPAGEGLTVPSPASPREHSAAAPSPGA
jgi:iron(III) transport system ATP-binding protein